MSDFKNRLQNLRNKYLERENYSKNSEKEKTEQNINLLNKQIQIAKKIQELNNVFIFESKNNNYTNTKKKINELQEIFSIL